MNKPIKLKNKLEKMIKVIEAILALALIVIVVVEGIYIVLDVFDKIKTDNIISESQKILSDFLLLAVTLEFAIMLIKKDLLAITDIFMIALARKVVLGDGGASEYLVAVITFALLIFLKQMALDQYLLNSIKEKFFNNGRKKFEETVEEKLDEKIDERINEKIDERINNKLIDN